MPNICKAPNRSWAYKNLQAQFLSLGNVYITKLIPSYEYMFFHVQQFPKQFDDQMSQNYLGRF